MQPVSRRARRLLAALLREYRDSRCADSAASLTYTTLFAVVPVMTVAFAVFNLLPPLSGLGERIESLVFSNFVPAAGEQVRRHLVDFATQASNLTTLGVLFLVVTSLLLLFTIEQAFNRIWHVRRQRHPLSRLLVYWALLTLGPLLLGGGFAVSSYLFSMHVVTATVERAGDLRDLLAIVPFLLSAAFFSIIYIAVPNCAVPVREGITGGIVAAMLLEGARHAFAFFVGRFTSYELVYGAFAAVPLFLLWIYISWMITLFGLVLVYVLANPDDEAATPATAFPAVLEILALFHTKQLAGVAVDDRVARLHARRYGIDNWHDLRERLLAARLLDRTEDGRLLLSCDLHHVRLADIARLLPWELVDRPAVAGTPEPDAFAQDIADRLDRAVAAFDRALDVSVAAVIERDAGSVPAEGDA